jgi:hypothetical protein
MTRTTEVSVMNKAEIIAELENMVAARLFSAQPWLADRETCSAVTRKLIQMGLWEEAGVEPQTWRITPLGKELNVELYEVFMGVIYQWDMPLILEEYASSTSQSSTLSANPRPKPMRNLFWACM